MKFALVNPNWRFDGSIYFGCREPHLPLEFGYAKAFLEASGAQARIIDGHLFGLAQEDIRSELLAYDPDVLVVTTAPSYLFWRCPPPELRIPKLLLENLSGVRGLRIAVGPHASVTPGAVLQKLAVDGVIVGEFEEVLPDLMHPSSCNPALWLRESGTPGRPRVPHVVPAENLPVLKWPVDWIGRHGHHHHRFDSPPRGPGAEIEASRGCPFHCSFCARESFRGPYRRRPLGRVIEELDSLLDLGVEYVYFIDETFFPDEALLTALAERPLAFGIQTRIDLWSFPQLEKLGVAGCVSIEAGVENLSDAALRLMGKPSLLSLEEITDRLAFARGHIPFIQANMLRSPLDDPSSVERWRRLMRRAGIWTNDPVPLFPFPGSPAYRELWGEPDDLAWERAHGHYLTSFPNLSDLQSSRPLPLDELENAGTIP